MRRSLFLCLLTVTFVASTLTTEQYIAPLQAAEPKPTLPIEKMRELAEIVEIIKESYVEERSPDELIEAAVRGMVSSLDPHSVYLDEKNLAAIKKSLSGEKYGGVGIYIGQKDGWIQIISPIDSSPASRAELKAGDLILKIEDISTQGIKIEKAVSMMRGKVGDILHLDILSQGEGQEPRTVELRRETIVTPSVLAALIEKDYGYLRISRFQEHTVSDLTKSLNRLYRENKVPLKGLVIDLRNNPGGILDVSVGVASIFLPLGKVVVSDRGRKDNAVEKSLKAKSEYYRGLENIDDLKSVPIVLLINNGSASASEIVAGAMQDYKRAVLMGVRSYGKASVQTIRQLHATQGKTGIKYTIARYYTPSGRSIQALGIEPDIVVVQQESTDEKIENKEFAIREANLIGHLEEEGKTAEEKTSVKKAPFVPTNDYQFDQAILVLKALGITAAKTH